MSSVDTTVAIVGLGYVGLPLATALARHVSVVGFDINESRVDELQRGIDRTGETLGGDLDNPNLSFTADPQALRDCQVIIVAVPTPIDRANVPDLEPLRRASALIGQHLSAGATVVYESTVYPGATEEVCLPILEETSGMKLGAFGLGYSPERINPGDHTHTLDKITKIVSGHDADTLERLSALYGLVSGSIHRAPNIRTAEAAKVIENIQRDLNIALMNELSLIFERVGIQTHEVLAAAGTKWNFHQYFPGLVGGHCIGVDPYYLTYRAQQLGYHPQVILAGRQINDTMAYHVGELTVRALVEAGKPVKGSTVLVLGLTFKEDVPDIRNSKVGDTIRYLQRFGVTVLGCDPLVDNDQVRQTFDIEAVAFADVQQVDAVVLANKHEEFASITLDDLKSRMNPPALIDIKNQFDRATAEAAGFHYRCL